MLGCLEVRKDHPKHARPAMGRRIIIITITFIIAIIIIIVIYVLTRCRRAIGVDLSE